MTGTYWHCLVVTLSLHVHQHKSKRLYLDSRNTSMEMNWTEWRSSSKREYLQCSEWDTISSCIYYTTLNVAQRRQRVSVRPFDIYDFTFGLQNNRVAAKMQLGDISVFLDEPLKGWYSVFLDEPFERFSNLDRVVGAETSWLSIDTCKSPRRQVVL